MGCHRRNVVPPSCNAHRARNLRRSDAAWITWRRGRCRDRRDLSLASARLSVAMELARRDSRWTAARAGAQDDGPPVTAAVRRRVPAWPLLQLSQWPYHGVNDLLCAPGISDLVASVDEADCPPRRVGRRHCDRRRGWLQSTLSWRALPVGRTRRPSGRSRVACGVRRNQTVLCRARRTARRRLAPPVTGGR